MEINELNVQVEKDNALNFKDEIFKVHSIKFKELNRKICLQSENGPCPLIAILNVLLLQGKVEIEKDEDFVTGDHMVHIVANYLMNLNESGVDIDVILRHFHQLQTGLIVDVCFSNVTDFKDDSNLFIFKFLNIKLYHGWIMDPQSTPDYERLRNYSYDQVTEELVQDSEDILSQNTKSFLGDFINSSQLTYHGLCQLNETMNEGELAVLFQNNHFSVIHKNNSVYSLCTDIGYSGDPGTVWLLLNSTSGDTEFVNDNFEPQTTYDSNTSTVDTDWQLAQKLAIEDDFEIARALQEEDEREMTGHASGHSTPSTTTSAKTAPNRVANANIPSKNAKKESSQNCILL